ncbi:uncharacterized protein ALTATR162_LOCUS8280 [Alternaria atra]|uniref:Uncharacterized protein n=1 Tax=Alternaria atra TaxID=119953 RepID=A0A8J2I7G2_9PLEO|nr:uncharacterized protein ALTATR162_LOCUS8280 [Alternaria atra]CAG5176030.1 unnamed protein product [Alternaria atra]
MILVSLLVMLLSPILIFAKSVPRAEDAKIHSQHTVCLSYQGSNRGVVTFNDPKENDVFDYAIVTKYTTYYPNALVHALVFNRFSTLLLDNDKMCGWRKVKSVYGSLGLDFHNHRGDIYWKYSDSAHISTSNGQTPSQESIDRISRILTDNPPAGDAYMFCAIILAWTTSLLGYILFMILLMTCIRKTDRNANESRDKEVDEGIELASIKAPDTDSLVGTTAAATPLDDVKHVYTSPHPGSLTSNDTTCFDPLPTYSRQGQGCGATFHNVRLAKAFWLWWVWGVSDCVLLLGSLLHVCTVRKDQSVLLQLSMPDVFVFVMRMCAWPALLFSIPFYRS